MMDNEQMPPADAGRLDRGVMQHTPGPWHAATADEWRTATGEHAQWGRFDISAGSNDPAAPNYYRIASVSNVNNAEQNQMNAKLIAAAPELLRCLQAVEVLFAPHCKDSTQADWLDRTQALLRRLGAA